MAQLANDSPGSATDPPPPGAHADDPPARAADPPSTSAKAPTSPKSTGRRRKPTAVAMAASEQALECERARGKGRQRKKPGDTGSVSRTSHGGVKIGGRAVTWVGGAGMSREVLDKMGIPQLRALFLKTFNHPTGSNNAEWLRKKLAQPSDPQVGAARAAVPRARDVAAEIWTTGTTFKGFTKQERFKLQQMGGNCAAKVVEVIKDQPPPAGQPQQAAAPARRRKRVPAPPVVKDDPSQMQVIGAETFKMPPPKRLRSGDEAVDTSAAGLLFGDCVPAGDLPPGAVHADVFQGLDGMGIPLVSGANGAHLMATAQHAQPWRTLHMEDASQLVRGVNVKVYRADERWHDGVLEAISTVGAGSKAQTMVQIYYWEHDQSEERPLKEFFRGDSNSLIQWQPPALGGMPVAGMPMAGVPMGDYSSIPMQGIPIQGGLDAAGGAMFAAVQPGAMSTDQHSAVLNGSVLRMAS